MKTKISKSWKALSPIGSGLKLEPFSEYLTRIYKAKNLSHIPSEVLEQWIHPLHQDDYTLRNYAWIDYFTTSFELQYWTFDKLRTLNIIPDFENMLHGIENPLESIGAGPVDMNVWEEKGTWRVRPIVLDVCSLKVPPPLDATIVGPYQLVEGHMRYRNLLIADNKKLKIAQCHQVFVMKAVKSVS